MPREPRPLLHGTHTERRVDGNTRGTRIGQMLGLEVDGGAPILRARYWSGAPCGHESAAESLRTVSRGIRILVDRYRH